MLYCLYMEEKKLHFPAGFLWGAATSSYQIEGGLTNDWSEWEKSPRRLADLHRRGLNPADYQSGLAANSWEMMDEDIECLKKINATAYRFSIEWARVEPEEGKFDEVAIARYADFIKKLQANNIEPFVTLWHWPVPLWLHKKGGWESKEIISYFKKYAEHLAQAFPTVKFWLTLNEPNIFAGNSFLAGAWPPQKKNPFTYLKVFRHLIAAHCSSFDGIKKILPKAQVGIASPNMDFESAGGIVNFLLKAFADWWWNHYFLNQIEAKQDFIGLNFYFHNRINYGYTKNKNERISEMGWELYPQSILPVLRDLHQRYHKPIYITENGLADAGDISRTWYIQEILKYTYQAIQSGADVRGYLHWSLLDNFEWAHGFSKKFGLFEVDYKTFERRPRPSALSYAQIIKDNAV